MLVVVLVGGFFLVRLLGDDDAPEGALPPKPSSAPASPTREPASPDSSAQPSTPDSPTAEPSRTPPATEPTEGRKKYSGEGLTDNALYNVYLAEGTGSCGSEVPDARYVTDAELEGAVNALVDCTVTALTKPLADQGIELTRPTLTFYDTTVETPCGATDAAQHQAYYCNEDQTIYYPRVVTADQRQVRFSLLDLMAHEMAHHIQKRAGMYDDYYDVWRQAGNEAGQLEQERRLELQAQCMSAVLLGHLSDDVGFTDADRKQIEWIRARSADDAAPDQPRNHGTSTTVVAWMDRGFGDNGWNDYANCNTWAADQGSVE